MIWKLKFNLDYIVFRNLESLQFLFAFYVPSRSSRDFGKVNIEGVRMEMPLE